MWKEIHKEIGTIKTGTSVNITYDIVGPVEPGFRILSMRASCGCSKPTILPDNAGIKIAYKAKPIPKHLLSKGQYTTTKRIAVDTTEGKVELTFKATIIK